MVIYPLQGLEWYSKYALIKLSTENISETIKEIKKEYTNLVTDYPFIYTFLDEDFNNLYTKEIQIKKLLLFSTIIAIIIASLGLIGLASFILNKKTKEIGIRKVMGASQIQIAKILINQFLVWIIISNIIAWPAAYYLIKKWLSNFAYHISISWITFLVVAIISMLIAIITISYHAYIASSRNPIDSLRYE